MPDQLIIAGGGGQDGEIRVLNDANQQIITLNGANGHAEFGGEGENGNLAVRNGENRVVIDLDGETGRLGVGGSGQSGLIHVRNPDGDERVRLHGESGAVELRNANGRTIILSGESAGVNVGENGQAGKIDVRNSGNKVTITHAGEDGKITLRDNNGEWTIGLNGNTGDIFVGGNGQGGNIDVRNKVGQRTIDLDGETGDIRLSNADCAEEFALAADQTAEPGTVMVLDDDGKVCRSSCPYDTRVVGVVSGAGGLKPGIVLDRHHGDSDRGVIALMGKVYCLVTAESAPIRVGDLLTTGDVPGHAMKVLDPSRSFGAVIGKAMAPLASGHGLIPILIALQ